MPVHTGGGNGGGGAGRFLLPGIIEGFQARKLLSVPVLPIADDEQVRRARRRSQARQRSRRGRASTIFTQGEGLGG